MSWTGALDKPVRGWKDLDKDDFYEQLNTAASYLNQLTSAFGKSTNRQWGRARDLVVEGAHDAEGTMRDNIAASLIIAVGLGVVVGYLIGRSSD